MTTRIVGADTYAVTWDAENRLVQVSKNGGAAATYVYDGDGKQVKATVGTVTTAYVGNYYEWRRNGRAPHWRSRALYGMLCSGPMGHV